VQHFLAFFSCPDPAGNGAAAHGGPRRVQLDGFALVAAGPAAASRRRNQWRPRLARLLPLLSHSGSRSWGRSASPGGCFLTVYDTGKSDYRLSYISALYSVADPDPGSDAFLTPGFGIPSGVNNPDHISER
jgi:hypothetical protein